MLFRCTNATPDALQCRLLDRNARCGESGGTQGRGPGGDALASSGSSRPRIGEIFLWEPPLDELIVYQTQSGGEDRGIPGRRTFEVICEQLRILSGGMLVDDLYFHFHDRFMTEGFQV